jgi:hypothetical protein
MNRATSSALVTPGPQPAQFIQFARCQRIVLRKATSHARPPAAGIDARDASACS